MRKAKVRSFEKNYERCLERLSWAVSQLDGHSDQEKIASTAELIIQTMSGVWRFFHTPEHIFEVGKSDDPIEVIAALFHDSIHVQEDVGVSINIGRMIAPYVRESGRSLTILSSDKLPADPTFELVCQIFGFKSEQALLSSCGQNEFLSAVVAGKCLEHALDASVIAKIAACIEATIPFRMHSKSGHSPSELLRERLAFANQRFDLGWSTEILDGVVKRSVRLANRDVENFAHKSAAAFLDNTWNLMPETNHDLIGTYTYTVSGYRNSLQKMEGFMSLLTPEVVFQRYKEEPSTQGYRLLIGRTQKNLEVARLYLGCKLLSIAVIEALSQRIGTTIPLATMMGELPQHGLPDAQMQSFLAHVEAGFAPDTPLEHEVLELLEHGRTKSSNYDVKNSPIATYIVRIVGFSETRRLLEFARQYFMKELSGEEFLERCPHDIVAEIVRCILCVFEVRVRALATPTRPYYPAIAVAKTV